MTVTSLTAEAASFSSRSIGCVTGQSSPHDVACGVFVGMGAVPTRPTTEDRLGDAVLFGCVPTCFTTVGGVPGIDLYPYASSVFRFGPQNRDELPPGSVTYACIQPGLGRGTVRQEPARLFRVCDGLGPAHHVGDLEIFHRDQVIRLHQCAGSLVVKVAAAVGDLAVPRGHGVPPVTSVGRSTLGTSEPLLSRVQSRCGSSGPARVVDVLTIAGGDETSDTDIDTNLTAGGRQRGCGHLVAGQDQHPAPALAPDLDRLHHTGRRAVCGDFHLSDALQVHPVCVGMPAGAVTVFGPLHTVESASTLEARISWCATGFHPPEEPVEGPVEPAQRGLLGRKRPRRHILACCPNLAQLRRLIPIPNPGLAVRPPVPAFLQRSVIEFAMPIQTMLQGDVLPGGRAHPEIECPPHATTSHWCWMYRRTVGSDTYPRDDEAKDEVDDNTLVRIRDRNSARSARAVRPEHHRIASAGVSLGRTHAKSCTWSGTTCMAAICPPILSHSSPSGPARIRYLRHHTSCSPSELTPPAERRKRHSVMPRRYKAPLTLTLRTWLSAPTSFTAGAASVMGVH
jgi:hypothetical protein